MSCDKVFDLTAGVYLYFFNIDHTQLANMSFDEIFDLAAGVYFYFYSNDHNFNLFTSNWCCEARPQYVQYSYLRCIIY